MTHSHVWHDSDLERLLVCDMTHSMCGVTHCYVCNDSFTCVSVCVERERERERETLHMCDMWHDSCTCVTWLIHVCDKTHLHVWLDSCTCVTWRIQMCAMTHVHLWNEPRTHHRTHWHVWRVTWLMHMCEMTHSHVWHDSCPPAKWATNTPPCPLTCVMCAVTQLHVWHASFIHVVWLIQYVTWLMSTCEMSHEHTIMPVRPFPPLQCTAAMFSGCSSNHLFTRKIKFLICCSVGGWWSTHLWVMSHSRVSVICVTRLIHVCDLLLRMQQRDHDAASAHARSVSFAEYSLFYRALLQKSPMF